MGTIRVHGVAKSLTMEQLHFHFSLSCIGEGHGNPLQCSCLENPRDGGAWWAAVYGVAQSRTPLKSLCSSRSFVIKCCMISLKIIKKQKIKIGLNIERFGFFFKSLGTKRIESSNLCTVTSFSSMTSFYYI